MKKLMGLTLSSLFIVIATACVGGGGSTSGGSSGTGTAGSFINCTSDDACPANQGCQLDTPSGDGYCANLCDNNAQCPQKFSCPEMVADEQGDCDDKGKHRNGLGVCEQFNRSRGPNTCASAPKQVPSTPVEASAPPVVLDGG